MRVQRDDSSTLSNFFLYKSNRIISQVEMLRNSLEIKESTIRKNKNTRKK